MIPRALVLWLLTAGAGTAQVLTFPGNASLELSRESALDSYVMPTGIWDRGAMPTVTAEGRVTRQAWRIGTAGLTTLQILRPLREQLRNAGFRILFDCQTEACGGFDFRFAVDTLPPPAMRIDIGDFRFLAATRDGAAGAEYISLFISRSAEAGFVEVTQITPVAADPVPPVAVAAPSAAPADAKDDAPLPLAAQLETVGSAVLADLSFDTGSAQLGPGPYLSLRALADYLADNPRRRVALVGHTDSAGSLDGNIALSRRRAGSVLERLVSAYRVPRQQLEAQGMGYLSPVASNLTEAGREANRRVEVIVTSTDP